MEGPFSIISSSGLALRVQVCSDLCTLDDGPVVLRLSVGEDETLLNWRFRRLCAP